MYLLLVTQKFAWLSLLLVILLRKLLGTPTNGGKQLFEVSTVNRYLTNRLSSEINLALSNYNSSDPIPNNFYNEEFEFNMIPCIGYVNNLIEDESKGKISLMPNLNCELIKVHIPDWNVAGSRRDLSAAELDRYLVERAGLDYLVAGMVR